MGKHKPLRTVSGIRKILIPSSEFLKMKSRKQAVNAWNYTTKGAGKLIVPMTADKGQRSYQLPKDGKIQCNDCSKVAKSFPSNLSFLLAKEESFVWHDHPMPLW